jgi:TDG/mug DNA glycosylase family protein
MYVADVECRCRVQNQSHREIAMPNPTRAELLAAADKTVTDVIAPDLAILFCGINPGLYTAWSGHHFARPGNRFWPALHLGGFTPRLFSPAEERELLPLGYGITNLVQRASATADELTKEEYLAGGQRLAAKVEQYTPAVLAVLGVGAYRSAFNRPRAAIGPQAETLGDTIIWVLPNPSGLNAHYTLEGLAAVFADLRRAVQK